MRWTIWLGVTILTACSLCTRIVQAQQTAPAASPPAQTIEVNLSSPRDAMFTFLAAMSQVHQQNDDQAWEAALATLALPADAQKLSQPDKLEWARDAARQLKTVIDQLGMVERSDLPDADAAHALQQWVFFPREGHEWVWEQLKPFGQWPQGRIVFEQTEPGVWRFSAQTVANIAALASSMAPLPPRHIAPQLPDTQSANDVVSLLGQTFTQTRAWQWGSLAGMIFLGLLAGRIAQSLLRNAANRLRRLDWEARGALFDHLASPLSLALLTLAAGTGLRLFIHLSEPLRLFVQNIQAFLYIAALGWFLYNLVEIIDILLRRLTEKTSSRLDDMVAPLIRKTLRIFLLIVFTLVVAQNIFGLDITGWLAGLGIAGLAVSLAAQDSVKNLFGSVTIFFDKPFTVGDFIQFQGQLGTVEEIGFRSTRIRLLSGALVTVPNMKIIDNLVENISARRSIRRNMNIALVYNTPPHKVEEAVQILRDVLHDPEVVRQGGFDMDKLPPRVAFNELNPDSFNICAYYWYQLAGDPPRNFFTYLDHCQLVNLMLLRRYAQAGIELAFPKQTVYLASDTKRELAVRLLNPADDRLSDGKPPRPLPQPSIDHQTS